MAKLLFDTYGKSLVRLLQVLRDGDRHEVLELTIQILFEGDLADSYVRGDNSKVLPTDTIKNTVYTVARQHPISCIENFASHLARHFLERLPHLEKIRIEITETQWDRIGSHAAAFVQNAKECGTTALLGTRSDEAITSGLRDAKVLKTSKSAFAGFARDEYTTLAATHDRLLGTVLDAEWTYSPGEIDFCDIRRRIRRTLLDVFAGHDSLSVQHTLYAMGEAVIAAFPAVQQIHLTMPNKHCLLVDLSKFGLDNPNEIFVPTEEPSGYIEAVVGR